MSSFKYDIILVTGVSAMFNISISIRFSTISSKINGKYVIKDNICDAELLPLYNH